MITSDDISDKLHIILPYHSFETYTNDLSSEGRYYVFLSHLHLRKTDMFGKVFLRYDELITKKKIMFCKENYFLPKTEEVPDFEQKWIIDLDPTLLVSILNNTSFVPEDYRLKIQSSALSGNILLTDNLWTLVFKPIEEGLIEYHKTSMKFIRPSYL